MATLIKQFTFVSNTNINPSQVNANFDDIVSFLNTNVVHTDGTRAMTAHLDLVASDPTTSNQATRKSYVDAAVAAASTSATNAQTTANAALPQAWISGGTALNVTSNGAGDIAVAHGLGVVPRTVMVVPYIPGGVTIPWTVTVEAKDAGNINVRVYHAGGAVWTGVTVSFLWLALR